MNEEEVGEMAEAEPRRRIKGEVGSEVVGGGETEEDGRGDREKGVRETRLGLGGPRWAGRWRRRSRSLGFGGSAQPTHLTLQVSSRAASLLSALGVCVMRPRCKIIIDKELAIDLRLLQCERN